MKAIAVSEYGVTFKYDYNIKNVDAFAQEVKNITLYAFDDNNNLVAMKAESGDMLATGEYAMTMDIDPRKISPHSMGRTGR